MAEPEECVTDNVVACEQAHQPSQKSRPDSKPFVHSSLRKLSLPAQIHGGVSIVHGHGGCARCGTRQVARLRGMLL
jgi:hypothetical protein